jgi:hypothetical protein
MRRLLLALISPVLDLDLMGSKGDTPSCGQHGQGMAKEAPRLAKNALVTGHYKRKAKTPTGVVYGIQYKLATGRIYEERVRKEDWNSCDFGSPFPECKDFH